jgi:hypothetical protein
LCGEKLRCSSSMHVKASADPQTSARSKHTPAPLPSLSLLPPLFRSAESFHRSLLPVLLPFAIFLSSLHQVIRLIHSLSCRLPHRSRDTKPVGTLGYLASTLGQPPRDLSRFVANPEGWYLQSRYASFCLAFIISLLSMSVALQRSPDLSVAYSPMP